MLNDPVGFSEINIVCGRTDLRYGIDSFPGVLRSLDMDPDFFHISRFV